MTPGRIIKNEIILASAGSGKTYRLTNRFISLLLLGVEPERIIALTFTRKAAGEFFDAILEKLARSAADPAVATQIAADLGEPEFDSAAALRLLRGFIEAMPRLALGTLDSFLADIVRSFPFELGIAGGFEILDDHGIAVERDRVYRRALGRNSAGGEDFLDAFKLATFGREDAGVMRNLDGFVSELHDLYLDARSPGKWGNADTIWQGDSPWRTLQAEPLDEICQRLQSGFEAADLHVKIAPRWSRFFDWVRAHHAGAPVPSTEKTLFNNLLAKAEDLADGSAVITVDRQKHELSPPECAALYQVVGHLIGGEIETRLRRTRGLWKVLERYESQYQDMVRRRGKLTFADLALLLAAHSSRGGSPTPGSLRRDQIDYRLDARFDHWLLDEFQDTSAVQWAAIENLVEEAVQDPEGRRSLFQVGDLKQAIYGWRGGDATLFRDLREKYSALGDERYHEEPLDISYRSSQPVIELVNKVFPEDGDIAALFPPMRGRWEFQEHSTVHAARPGFATWIAAEKVEGSRPPESELLEARLAIAADIIREIDPLARGLSIAVLVSRNSAGSAATDYLRAATGLPITNDANIGIAGDNPLTVALRSLYRCAAHPGDRFAWEHLRMTPFVESLPATPGELSTAVLDRVWKEGFESTTRHWIAKLAIELDPFTTGRAEAFAQVAARFDEFGERSADGFLRFMENHRLRDSSSGGSVQVMTVHKAKGLGFDIVILPDLGGKSLDTLRRQIGVQRDANREVEWVLQLPNKDLAEADETLREFRDERAAEACYEQLCKYYVALTRAKFANYLITDSLGKRSTSKNFVKLLDESLREDRDVTEGTIFETGTAKWFTELPAPQNSQPSEFVPRPLPAETKRRPRNASSATAPETSPTSAEEIFLPAAATDG